MSVQDCAAQMEELESRITSRLGVAIKLAAAATPIGMDDLNPMEQARLRRFKSKIRQNSWRLGRQALRSLKIRDTHELVFPNAGLSITHSGRIAVAAKTEDASILGLGIDLEVGRFPKVASARFFLSKEERGWLGQFNERESKIHRLRLWTIKESLFKANTAAKIPLFRFRLADPGRPYGKALPGCMFYASFPIDGGYFSAAVLRAQRKEIPPVY